MRSYVLISVLALAIAALLAVQACGAKSSKSGVSDFTLTAFAEWNLPAGQPDSFRHAMSRTPDGDFEVSVYASGDDVRGALLRLRFDASEFRIADSSPGAGFAGRDVVYLCAPTADGADIAVILAGLKDAAGFSGEREIVRLTFTEGSDITRRTSAAPGGDQNRATITTAEWDEDGNLAIAFTGRNIGDYDLNGVVGVPDVTEIALNYLAEVPGASSPLAVIDGDGSGTIGISDITPIALNYLNTLSGYNIQYSADGGSNWEFADVQTNPNINVAYEDNTGFSPWPNFELTMGEPYVSGLPGFEPDNDNLRVRATPHDGSAFGVPGIAKKPTGGEDPPPIDTTPPEWDNLTQRGVISVLPVDSTRALDVLFGSATDADSPPVEYLLYYALESEFNIADLEGTTTLIVLSKSGNGPFTERLTGLEWSTTYTVLVRARDSAVPPNSTADMNPQNGTVTDEVIVPTDFIFTSISVSPGTTNPLGTPITITASGDKTGPGTVSFVWSDNDPEIGFFYDQTDTSTTSEAGYGAGEPGTYELTIEAYIFGELKDSESVEVTISDSARIYYDPDVISAAQFSGCNTCHAGGSPAAGIDFTDPASYDVLVWVVSDTDSSLYRAYPGNGNCIIANIGRGSEPSPPNHGAGGPVNPFKAAFSRWILSGGWRSEGNPPPPKP